MEPTINLLHIISSIYTKILQTITLTIIPTTSAVRAAIIIPLVFLTLIQLVYIAIVYKVVSVDPIIVDAIAPIRLSDRKSVV